MVLTGQHAYDNLKKAYQIIKDVSEANVVDCPDDYLLLISSRAALIRSSASELTRTYDALWNKSITKQVIDASEHIL